MIPVAQTNENRTSCPRYRRKWVWDCKTWKLYPAPSLSLKTGPGAQNMNTGPSALYTTENGSVNTGSDALYTVENEYGSEKHENSTWSPRYQQN
jgi:hypothetical protein